jgi:hypothetical protein
MLGNRSTDADAAHEDYRDAVIAGVVGPRADFPLLANLAHRRAVDPSVERAVAAQDLLSVRGVYERWRLARRSTAPLWRGEMSLGSDPPGPASRQ